MHNCSICAKSFPSPYKLQRHHRIHTGQKPFTCTICGHAFNQPEHLKSHAQRVHPLNHSTDNLSLQYLPSRINEHTQEKYRYDGVPAAALSSSVSFPPGQKREMSPLDTRSPSSEMKDHSTPKLHVNDSLGIQNDITNGELKLDSVPQDNVDSSTIYNPASYAHSGFTCQVCLKSFSSFLQLQIHLPIHKSFACGTGGESFSGKSNLNGHSKSHNLGSCGGKITLRHQCPTCLKTFCSPSKLKRHFLIHTGQKPFSCSLCRKTFRQETHLKSHLSVGHKELFHQIEPKQLCDGNERHKSSFHNDCLTADLGPQSSVLQHHSSQDNPGNSSVELELQCKISLSAPQDLGISRIKSEATSEPQKYVNYKSQQQNGVCCETLSKPVVCEQGYLTHKNLKPFRCATCSRSFRLELNLIRHQICHKSLKSQSCNPVEDTWTTTSDHTKTEPEVNYASPVDLNIIVKPETWSENISSNDEDLRESVLNVSPDQKIMRDQSKTPHQIIKNRLHQCYACSKSFQSLSKLQRHMLTHTGQRPFDCQACGKSFRQKTHLRVHYRTHLWSRYHKQRSLYISRPPSRLPGCTTRPSADVQEVFIQSNNLKKGNARHKSVSDVDLLSESRLGQTSSLLSVSAVISRETHILPSTTKKNEALHLSTVTKMTVKDRQNVKHLHSRNQIQHTCVLCFKCFPSPSKLQRHEMVHTGLKPFQCLVCGKMFRQAVHLKGHERTHFNWRHPKTVQQQGTTTNTKERSQQLLYPRIRIYVPPQKRYLKTVRSGYAQHNSGIQGECEQNPPKTQEPITKCKNVMTRFKHKTSCDKRKLHMCRMCRKNFVSPYKLSRHLLTHYGIKPYKCSLCDKTFRQLIHLKVHERSRVHKMAIDCIQERVTGTNPQDHGCLDNVHAPETVITAQLIGYEGETVGEHPQSWYTSAGHYAINDDLSPVSEGLAVPSADFLELNMEADCEPRGEHNQTMPFDQSSFASELTSEIQRLVQNQELAGLTSSQRGMRDDIHCSLGTEFQATGIPANSDSHKAFSEGHGNGVVGNLLRLDSPDDYWCKPLSMFQCDKCSEGFETEQDVQHHKCKAESHNKTAQPVSKYCCEVCLKTFGSPWKLERHYVIHTGQRPFKCNICGKTFTQTAHLRSHQQTHKRQ